MKKQWQVFINEMIKHGDKVRAYKNAYPNAKSDNAAQVNAIRLLKNDNILSAIKAGSAEASKIASKAAIHQAAKKETSNLLSAIEKRTILAKIARGDAQIMENAVTKDGEIITFYRTPNSNEIIKAIESDNKMTGENAPTKLEHSGEVRRKVIFNQVRADGNS